MKWFMRILLVCFFGLWSLLMLLYAAVLAVFNQEAIDDIHEAVPPLEYIWSFIGVYDNTHTFSEQYEQKKEISSNLADFLTWKQEQAWTGEQSIQRQGNWLELFDTREEIEVYSPVWIFGGEVSTWVVDMEIVYTHKGRDITKTIPVNPLSDDGSSFVREQQVDFGKETMFNGKNTYRIQASFADGTRLAKKVLIQTTYERVEVDNVVLYIDTSYIPPEQKEDILREAPDFWWEMVQFISHGCDPEANQQPILMQHSFQYKTIPACMNFSLKQDYLLWYEFHATDESTYRYDVMTPDDGMVYNDFPLFEYVLGTSYMNLVFRAPQDDMLHIMKATGDELSYGLHLIFYDMKRKTNLVEVVHTDGNQLLVSNQKETMFIYLYKQRAKYKSLIYPWLRFQYMYQWRRINQGNIYTLPIRVYGPYQGYGSTYRFTIIIDDEDIVIDDTFKITRFNMYNMWATISVTDKEQPLNQSSVCDDAYVAVYKDALGEKIEDAGDAASTLWLVGKGMHSSYINIFHNDATAPRPPEQMFAGYFHERLHVNRGNLVPWKNTYTIIGLDDAWRRVCEKEVEVMVE